MLWLGTLMSSQAQWVGVEGDCERLLLTACPIYTVSLRVQNSQLLLKKRSGLVYSAAKVPPTFLKYRT